MHKDYSFDLTAANQGNRAIEQSFKQMIETGDPKNFSGFVRNDLQSNVRAYYESVTECVLSVLESTFPSVVNYLKRPKARLLMMDYIRDGNLPSSGDMRFYGDNFADWLKKNCVDVGDVGLISDLATYDFTINEMAYLEDYEPVSKQEFLNFTDDDYEHMRFSFPKAFRLLSFSSSIFDALENSKKATHLVINRPKLEINVYELDRDDFLFLQSIMSGQTLDTANMIVSEIYPDFKVDLALIRAIERGYFSGIEL